MTDGRACCTPAPQTAIATASVRVARHSTPIPRRWTDVIGGTFKMGTDDAGLIADGEGPARLVSVSPFAMACHAVSNMQFADFVRATNFTTDAERAGWSYVFVDFVPEAVQRRGTGRLADTPWWVAVPHAYWAQPEGPHSSALERLDHPAVHISWNDAQAYCDWSATRLPTEAEWEFAARGGLAEATYPWGNELAPGGEHRCNIWQGSFPARNDCDDGYAGTAPVHAFAANGYGLHNMAGNVWEWCADAFSTDYHRKTAATDPLMAGATNVRSLRGGSYLCHESYCHRYRVAARSSNTADSSAGNMGFRVVRTDPDATSRRS